VTKLHALTNQRELSWDDLCVGDGHEDHQTDVTEHQDSQQIS
jgi:hypothetical protein